MRLLMRGAWDNLKRQEAQDLDRRREEYSKLWTVREGGTRFCPEAALEHMNRAYNAGGQGGMQQMAAQKCEGTPAETKVEYLCMGGLGLVHERLDGRVGYVNYEALIRPESNWVR